MDKGIERNARDPRVFRREVRRFAVSVWLTVALLTGIGVGSASAQARTFLFDGILVEGNQRIEEETILSYLSIEPGTEITAGELNEALRRVQDSGLFESVSLDPDNAVLVVDVQEFPTINRISFEGNRRIRDSQLESVIESSTQRIYSPAQAERDAATIAEAYAQQGRIAAKVTPRVIRREDNRIDLIYEISEGTTIEIERISIVGNKAYSERRLRRVLASKQAGFLRAFAGADTLVEDRIEVDSQLLRDFYLSRGYVDFRVLHTDVELTRERDGFFVVFHVHEGQQFRLGEILTVSDIPGIEPEPYQEALRIKPGVVYSPVVIETSIVRQERLAEREGHDFVRVRPEVNRNAEELTLDLTLVLERGESIFIERIDISGNTTTLDRVIRRQFRVVEGDPFNPRVIAESADRIRALDYFETTDIDVREGSAFDQRIVDVKVEERPTGSLNLGGTYSETQGFGAAIRLQERNFLGRGQRVVLELVTAEEEETYSLRFTEPYFLGRDVEFDGYFGLAGQTLSALSYDNERTFFSSSLTFPISPNGRLSTRYFFDNSDMVLRADSGYVGQIIRSETSQDRRSSSGLGLRYTWDSRFTGLNPNAGTLMEFGADFAGLGGDTRYIKPQLRLIGQTRVLNEEVTLRATLEAGRLLWRSDKPTTANDRFVLNSNDLRGFVVGGIGPRQCSVIADGQCAGPVNNALGGNSYQVLRLDAEFPLPIPDEIGMRGGAFYDIGNLNGLKKASTSVCGTEGNAPCQIVGAEAALRHVAGVSLLWDTPLGPLRFNWSRALKKEKYDKSQNFDLTLQVNF